MLPYTLTIWLRDASGSKSSATIHIDRGASFTAAESAAGAIVGLVRDLTGCTITSYELTKEYLVIPPPDKPAVADSLQRGLLIFAAGPSNYFAATIPAVKPALVLATGDDAGIGLDESAPAVSALIAALIAGPWSAPNAIGLTALEAAYREVLP